MGNHKKTIWKCQATFCLRQGPLHPLPIPYISPSTYPPLPLPPLNYNWVNSAIPWYNGGGDYGQYCCDNCICLWALCIIQRTHAKQCYCMSEGSMLFYTHIHLHTMCIYKRKSPIIISPLQHPPTKCTSAQLPTVPPLASPQPAPLQHGPTWEH